ncbi:MAG: DNA replication/repair protein RecF [Bacteroidota bacterium]
MKVTHIHLRNFRNHSDSDLRFSPAINVLLGENGQGKTNIIEAISYISLTKSFYGASDGTVLQIGRESFAVEEEIETDGGNVNHVSVSFCAEPGEKDFLINGIKPESLASVIGRFPVVVLSPEHGRVTFGGPADRRKFIDIILSQLSRSYLTDLLEYRRVLRQRNKILTEQRNRGALNAEVLASWNTALAEHGSKVIVRRFQFVQEFGEYVTSAYRQIAARDEEPALMYMSSVEADPISSVEQRMSEALARRKAEEFRRGTTLVGPHRDDLRFSLNGMNVQEYASQGQHKTFLVALKMAEFFYLKERTAETPIFLLDDVFSELDEQRTRNILEVIQHIGQTIITSTDESVFRKAVAWGDTNRRFRVEKGTVKAA